MDARQRGRFMMGEGEWTHATTGVMDLEREKDLTPGLSATPLSINGEGELTPAAAGVVDLARGNGHLPTADVTSWARGDKRPEGAPEYSPG